MKLFILTATIMCAFAGNSLLTRAGIQGDHIDPLGFGLVRLTSAVLILHVLLAIRPAHKFKKRLAPNWPAIIGLVGYFFGFSMAYGALNAGVGALILFGCVQITMFLSAVVRGDAVSTRRWIGTGISIGGLVFLMWPSGSLTLPPLFVALMAAAGIGWGVYSVQGGKVKDPLQAATWIFSYSLPLLVLVSAPFIDFAAMRPMGIFLATVSGALTAGFGSILWFIALPQLGVTRAALSQLSVPAIALVASAIFLNEALALQSIVACALICGGIAFGILGTEKQSQA